MDSNKLLIRPKAREPVAVAQAGVKRLAARPFLGDLLLDMNGLLVERARPVELCPPELGSFGQTFGHFSLAVCNQSAINWARQVPDG